MSSYKGTWPPPYEPWRLSFKRPEDRWFAFETFETFRDAVMTMCAYMRNARYEGYKFTIEREKVWTW